MKTGKRWVLCIGAAAAVCSLAPSYFTTRPGTCPGLPCYDYVHGAPSPPASVFSLDAVPLDRAPATAPGALGAVRERVKFFQMSQTTVQVDHCFLSRVVLTLHESGEWTLSMRADQNPWMTGPGHVVSTPVQLTGAATALQPPIPKLGFETEGLKRNLFIVKVRCYAGYTLREAQPTLDAAKPVLFELPEFRFWVQRGTPYDFWDKQPLVEVGRYFDLIDRVEVEFSYR